MATTFHDGYEIELSDKLYNVELGSFREWVIGGVRSIMDPTGVGTVVQIPKLVDVHTDISSEIRGVLFKTFQATIQSLFKDAIDPDDKKNLRIESLIEWNTKMRQSEEVITVTKSDLRYPGSSKFCVQAYVILQDTCAHYNIPFEHEWIDFAKAFSTVYSEVIRELPKTLQEFREKPVDEYVREEKSYYEKSKEQINLHKERTSILLSQSGESILLSKIAVESEIYLHKEQKPITSKSNDFIQLFLGENLDWRLSILEADRGMGKSVLLEQLFEKLHKVCDISNVFIIKPSNAEDFSGKPKDWKELIQEVYRLNITERLESRKVYLLIDGVFDVFYANNKNEVWKGLIEIVKSNENLKIIATCRGKGVDKKGFKAENDVQILEITGYSVESLSKYISNLEQIMGVEVCEELKWVENPIGAEGDLENYIINELARSPMYIDLIQIRTQGGEIDGKPDKISFINSTINVMFDKIKEREGYVDGAIWDDIINAATNKAVREVKGRTEGKSSDDIDMETKKGLKKVACFTADLDFIHDSFKEALAIKHLFSLFLLEGKAWAESDFNEAIQIIDRLTEKEDTGKELLDYAEKTVKERLSNVESDETNYMSTFTKRFFTFFAQAKEGKFELNDVSRESLYNYIRVARFLMNLYKAVCEELSVTDIKLGSDIDESIIWQAAMKNALKEINTPFYFADLNEKNVLDQLLKFKRLKLNNPRFNKIALSNENWRKGGELTIQYAGVGTVKLGEELKQPIRKRRGGGVTRSFSYDVQKVEFVDSELEVKLNNTIVSKFIASFSKDSENGLAIQLANASITSFECSPSEGEIYYASDLRNVKGESDIGALEISQSFIELANDSADSFIINNATFKRCQFNFKEEGSFKRITLKNVTFKECEFKEESIFSISEDSENIRFNDCKGPYEELSKDPEDISNIEREFLKLTTNSQFLFVKNKVNNIWTFQEDKSMEQHQVLTEFKERVKAELENNVMKSLQTFGKYLKSNSNHVNKIRESLDKFDPEKPEAVKSTIERILDDLSFEDIKLEYAFSDKMYDHICVIAPASAHEGIKKNDFPKKLFPNSSFADSVHRIPEEAKILVFYAKGEDFDGGGSPITPWGEFLSEVLELSVSEGNKRYVLFFANARSKEIRNEKYIKNTISANSYIPLYARLRELQDHIRQRAALQLSD